MRFEVFVAVFAFLVTATHTAAGAPAKPAKGGKAAKTAKAEVVQVLVVPIAASDAALSALAAELTSVLVAVTQSTGSEPVAAQVAKSDITAVIGCASESRECFRAVTDTVGVDRMTFGSIEPAAETPAPGKPVAVVSLTLIRPADKAYQTRRIELHSSESEAAKREFEVKARAFFRGEPEPAWSPEVDRPTDRAGKSSFSLGRVKPYSWGIAGGGIALVGTGAILLGMAGSRQAEVDGAPVSTVEDFENLVDLETSGKRLNRFGNAFLIGGSVALVAGLILMVEQAYSKEKPAAMKVSVGATRGRGLTLALEGRF